MAVLTGAKHKKMNSSFQGDVYQSQFCHFINSPPQFLSVANEETKILSTPIRNHNFAL